MELEVTVVNFYRIYTLSNQFISTLVQYDLGGYFLGCIVVLESIILNRRHIINVVTHLPTSHIHLNIFVL